MEAVKAVADLYSPVDGEVTAVNEALADDPAIVNQAAFDDGWMVRAKLADAAQLDGLLSVADYTALLKELGEKA